MDVVKRLQDETDELESILWILFPSYASVFLELYELWACVIALDDLGKVTPDREHNRPVA